MNSTFLLVETSKILSSTFRVERSIEDDGVLKELKNNIEKYGIKVPLIVKKMDKNNYQLIDGSRRYQVAVELGLKTVPCIIEDEDLSTAIKLSVNIHREDLLPIEIGKLLIEIYNDEKSKDNNFKYAKLSSIVNKSKAYISQHIGYVEKLLPEIQKDMLENKRFIDKNILNRIYVLDNENQKTIYNKVISEKLGRENVQKLIDGLNIDDIEKEENINTSPLLNNIVTDVLHISNIYIEFKLKSDVLNDTNKKQFEEELMTLFNKYNLSVGV